MAGSRSIRKSMLRIGLVLLAILVATPTFIGLMAYHRLHFSLPITDGEATLPGLSERVLVARDAYGIPTISGTNRKDVSRAMGFLHAQERFFQMDLTRRKAAGELSELFGESALKADKHYRIHRFRTRAKQIIGHIPDETRGLLKAYADGVNRGLQALEQPPVEYLAMLTSPEPWTMEDSILCVFAMYFSLQDSTGEGESARGLMADILSPEVYAFLNPPGTNWDAPIDGSTLALPEMPANFGLDTALTDESAPLERSQEEEAVPGSNNWALSGELTPHGGAIIANDMHLRGAVPNVWYRASIEYMHDERPITVTGVSFPGTPVMTAASNGNVAWGFTNSYGDWYDLVELEQPTSEEYYLTPHGELEIEHVTETINLRNGRSESMDIRETIWGPIVSQDHRGTARAYKWVAHTVRAINLNLMKMEWTQNISEGLDVAKRIGMPAQNIVMGDSAGDIAWTIAGAIPKRVGFDGKTPTSWADGTKSWDGWLQPEDYPQVVNPEGKRIWTANSRVVGDEMLETIGDGDYALGARTKQIRDALLELDSATEENLFAIQLDQRALFLEPWQELLVNILSTQSTQASTSQQELLKLVQGWDAQAGIDSVGYALVRAFRLEVRNTLFGALLSPLREHDANFDYLDAHRQMEGPLWELVTREPKGWLPREHSSWNSFLLSCIDSTITRLTKDGTTLADQTWGRHNAPRIAHPFSRMFPALGRWLDMPHQPLPGDSHMPRVQSGTLGASERMVVSPGHEEDGILHMPSSQTGHIWAPYFGKGHQEWVEGIPTPFLPGETQYRLILSPEKES